MADSGLLIGWKNVVPGREVQAVELWSTMLVYLRTLHAEGHVERFEPVMLGAHGGNLNGFVLVRGEQSHLDRVRNSDEFLELVVTANKTLDGFTVVRAHFGDEVAKLMRLYATV